MARGKAGGACLHDNADVMVFWNKQIAHQGRGAKKQYIACVNRVARTEGLADVGLEPGAFFCSRVGVSVQGGQKQTALGVAA